MKLTLRCSVKIIAEVIIMTPEMLFDQYSYLVEKYVAMFNLDEDDTQTLALALWEHANSCLDSENGVSYFHAHLRRVAQNCVDRRNREAQMQPAFSGVRFCVTFSEYNELQELLAKAKRTLTERQAEFIRMYYEEGYNCSDIAEAFNITPTRVHQILSTSLIKIRGRMAADHVSPVLRDYLHFLESTAVVSDRCAYM